MQQASRESDKDTKTQSLPEGYLNLLTEVNEVLLQQEKDLEVKRQKEKEKQAAFKVSLEATCRWFAASRWNLKVGDLVLYLIKDVIFNGKHYLHLVPDEVLGITVEETKDDKGIITRSGAIIHEHEETIVLGNDESWMTNWKEKKLFAVSNGNVSQTVQLIRNLYPGSIIVFQEKQSSKCLCKKRKRTDKNECL